MVLYLDIALLKASSRLSEDGEKKFRQNLTNRRFFLFF